ncbi:hypothetical protein GCM10011511_03040 [Puia dinghuensis]|uniref:Tetratricopeptide repeat protein n=2 Tax=Puia dinghuensis TaxID=1792502 RepID=A0A8J2XQ08_9BACT|nr:hypothetical protein GCM10011511_03040 [Puia dinghuensis]
MLCLLWLSLVHFPSFGQNREPKIVYIIDSIPIVDDPEEGDDLLPNDISDMTVIKNKDSLKSVGYERFDGVFYIFTKAYRARPDSIKSIPSTNRMPNKDGVLYWQDQPYSGVFINYYLNGNRKAEGRLLKGVIGGMVVDYYPNGQMKTAKEYKAGKPDGPCKEFYPDGSLRGEGRYVEGQEDGVWHTYFPNGKIKLYDIYQHGVLVDSAIRYYSNGTLEEKVMIKGGKAIPDEAHARIDALLTKSAQSYKEDDIKSAIRHVTKAIELDSGCAKCYFSRATLKLNDMQFDEAISDFDKTLAIEPYMETALANRAFARIRKYQFGNDRTILKNKDVTVLGSGKKSDISQEDKEKICGDLQQAVFLGDRAKMVLDALQEYCQKK